VKIKILANHKYIDEIQTIAQIFFPHTGFCYADEKTDHIIISKIEGGKVYCDVIINNKSYGHYSLKLNDQPFYLNEKRLVMLVLFYILKNELTTYTPWGALTGVRPTKMVREWLENGQNDAQVITILKNVFYVKEDRAQLAIDVAHSENRVAARIPGDYIGIYVSIPFCPSRCIYCSFNTESKPLSIEMQELYIKTLVKECSRLPQKNISSIYIGGGTPTALCDHLLEELLDALPNINGEFTVEAGRPDTITRSNLALMRKRGVNRISINCQTLNNSTLEKIGRKHTVHDFYRAFEMAREEGFDCINTDIIAGLPNEGPKDMERTMEGLVSLSPENITIHTLAVKRASKLNEHRIVKKLDYPIPQVFDIEAQLKIAHNMCLDRGMEPYYLYRQKNMAALFENTGYSVPGKECIYNIGMMSEIQTVLGVGAGAVSKYIEGTKITRNFNPKNLELYIKNMERRTIT